MDIHMSFAMEKNPRNRAIFDHEVKPEAIEFTCTRVGPSELFWRQLRFAEFDVSEMSFSSYLVSRFEASPPFIAIPVFPSRSFRHSGIYIHTNSGIQAPEDLIGKRIGCAEYQLTANVWIRGMLSDEYGVTPSSFLTLTGGLEQPGRIEKAGVSLPPGIETEAIEPTQTLSEMLDRGEIDALFTPRAPSCFVGGSAKVRRLFEDTYTAEREYYQRTKIFPIMHLVAIRREVYEENPWVAQSLFKGFEEARRMAYKDLHETAALKVMLPWLIRHVADTEEIMGPDFWIYGYEPNREGVDRLLRYHHEQGLSARQLTGEEIFAPETLESFKI